MSVLPLICGDETARTMLVDGETLASLMDAMFSGPVAHRDAVRSITDALDDFLITAELGPIWHLRYLYEDKPGSFRVVDIEIATPAGTLSSRDVWLRLPV